MSKELVSLITEAANYLTSADNENPQGADMQLGMHFQALWFYNLDYF